MKKFLEKIGIAVFLIILSEIFTLTVFAASATDGSNFDPNEEIVPPVDTQSSVMTPLERMQNIGGETGLNPFLVGQHPDAASDFATPGLGTITSPYFFALDFGKLAFSGVAIIIIIYMSIKLVNTNAEDEYEKAKSGIFYGVLGFFLIQIADILVRKMFFGETGDIFSDAGSAQSYAEESVKQMRGIIGFVELFVGVAAVLVLVIRGFTMVSSGGDEEQLKKARNQIIYALVGIFLIGLSELIVRGFIFPNEGKTLPDVDVGKRIIVMVTNYISGFIAVICFAMLFYQAYKYVVSAGDSGEYDNLKKTALSIVFALLLAFGAFALVNTVISFEEPQEISIESIDLPVQ